MKKIFEIPQLKIVRFEEADIILSSGCCPSDGILCWTYSLGCTNDDCYNYTMRPGDSPCSVVDCFNTYTPSAVY